MALRWLEAFQAERNTTILGRLYTDVAGAIPVTITDEYGRTLPGSQDLTMRTPAVVPAVENSWVIGFGFQMVQGVLAAAPASFPHIGLRNLAGDQLRLEAVDASETKPGGSYYKWRVMRGATVVATTVERFSGAIIDERRTYFEFKVTVRTGANGSFSLRYHTFKGGMATATWSAANTGVNTANQGTDGADRFTIAFTAGLVGTVRVAYSDIIIMDSTGSVNNDFLGKIYSEALKPAGNGNELDWILAGGAASIEDAWNEPAATQSVGEDDKRVTSDTVGDISLATMSNLSALFGATPIVGLQYRLFGKMETTGTRDVQFFYRKTTGSPAQVGTSILDLNTTSIVGEADTRETNPNTSAAWVLADINGLELGVELDA